MKKSGFTLAEVLITLGIIGVVAALTMPTLIANHQKATARTAAKKAQSILGQAVYKMYYDNGETLAGLCEEDEDHNCFAEKLLPYLNYTKYLPADSDEMGDYLTNELNSARPHIILNDGMILQIYHGSKDCILNTENNEIYLPEIQYCAGIYVDINGTKLPNKHLSDIFSFSIVQNKVVPFGSPLLFLETKIPTDEQCKNKQSTAIIRSYCTYKFLYQLY